MSRQRADLAQCQEEFEAFAMMATQFKWGPEVTPEDVQASLRKQEARYQDLALACLLNGDEVPQRLIDQVVALAEETKIALRKAADWDVQLGASDCITSEVQAVIAAWVADWWEWARGAGLQTAFAVPFLQQAIASWRVRSNEGVPFERLRWEAAMETYLTVLDREMEEEAGS